MDDYFKIKVSEVLVNDESRQRKSLSGIEELAGSIDRIGQLNAIILDEKNNLIAGRRRLEAMRYLGRETVLARRFQSLDTPEKKLIELDENLRRVDLPWQENTLAILELHELKVHTNPAWQQSDTAEYTNFSVSHISYAILVGQALRLKDQKVAACSSLVSAADLLRRRRALALEAAMEKEFGDDGTLGKDDLSYDFGLDESPVGEPVGGIYTSFNKDPGSSLPPPDGAPEASPVGGGGSADPILPKTPPQFAIVAGDFLSVVGGKRLSRKFNLLHCDFPYGINFDKSDQGASETSDAQYADTKEIFWGLTRGLLEHQEEFLAPSAHMIFWYSMNYHSELVDLLSSFGWFVVPTPLIWHKSCNSGIASDYRRRPKHIYETALFCSRGDRQILTLKNDHFSAPLARNKESHISAKPQEMLEYFLSMVVTEHTVLLDPTCGSGTSVRAAASLGAESALGIELNPEVAATARTKLSLFLSNRGPSIVPES